MNDIELSIHDNQIIAAAIDEFKKRTLTNFCCYCNQQACDGGMVGSIQECETVRMLRDVLEDISDELKGE